MVRSNDTSTLIPLSVLMEKNRKYSRGRDSFKVKGRQIQLCKVSLESHIESDSNGGLNFVIGPDLKE